jgi:hypothetical protein
MSNWARVREFGTRFEAEMARERLESAGIPSTIKAHEAGLFGAGFQGVIPSGVELLVPEAALSAAQQILSDE